MYGGQRPADNLHRKHTRRRCTHTGSAVDARGGTQLTQRHKLNVMQHCNMVHRTCASHPLRTTDGRRTYLFRSLLGRLLGRLGHTDTTIRRFTRVRSCQVGPGSHDRTLLRSRGSRVPLPVHPARIWLQVRQLRANYTSCPARGLGDNAHSEVCGNLCVWSDVARRSERLRRSSHFVRVCACARVCASALVCASVRACVRG
jgi:hypothetical protein